MAHLKLDGGWKVTAVVDVDFHLILYVSNEDETPITQIGEELGNQPQEIRVRFTTVEIEAENLDKQPKV
jgi:hypothetical protein